MEPNSYCYQYLEVINHYLEVISSFFLALLDKFDCNVIVVDWSILAAAPYYEEAASNVYVVSNYVTIWKFLLLFEIKGLFVLYTN